MFGDYGLEEVFAALDSLKVEMQMMKEPMGRTKDNPGRSCMDIWLCHPDFPSGKKIKTHNYNQRLKTKL